MQPEPTLREYTVPGGRVCSKGADPVRGGGGLEQTSECHGDILMVYFVQIQNKPSIKLGEQRVGWEGWDSLTKRGSWKGPGQAVRIGRV